MNTDQIYSLNQRKLEALCGFYSHKDIPFFIHQVLTYFETPIQKKYLISKEIQVNIFQKKKDTNEEKSSSTNNPIYYNNNPFNHNLNTLNSSNTINSNDANESNKLSFPQAPSSNNQSNGFHFNNSFSQNTNKLNSNDTTTLDNTNQNNKFSFPQPAPLNNQTNGFHFNNPFSQNTNTLNSNETATLHDSNQNNKFSFPQTPSSYNPFNQNSNRLNSNETNNTSVHAPNNISKQPVLNNSFGSSIISKEPSLNSQKPNSIFLENQNVLSIIELFNNEHQKHQFIQITSNPQDIENNDECQLLCHIAQDEKTKQYLFASRQITNIKKNIVYKYKLPENYSWVSSYTCLEDSIFYIPLMHLCLNQDNKNQNQQKLFENIHSILSAFENLLNNILIPCLKHKELSKSIHPKIKEAITLPVIIAFHNEFKESQYSIKNLLINQKSKEIDIKWLNEEINFKKDVLVSYNLLPENELELWINNCEFTKKCYLYYT